MSDPAELTRNIRAALSPCSLVERPTPLEDAPALARALGAEAVWVKREDRTSRRCGGNKVRGLEFLLAGAPAHSVFLTAGATGSSHCLATAVHARALGHRAVLVQFPQPETDTSRAVAAACGAHAALVVRARSPTAFPLALARAWLLAGRLGVRRWIPGGGADPRAAVGHALAALELADQVPGPPDAVLVPLGSGATAAGLLLGLSWLGWPTRVVAVRVAPSLVANRWRVASLARGAARLLRRHDVPVPLPPSPFPEVIDGRGAGYGHPSPAGERARSQAAEHGLLLDPTYGAKALAALPQLVARGFRRMVFWHTFAPPPSPRVPEGRP